MFHRSFKTLAKFNKVIDYKQYVQLKHANKFVFSRRKGIEENIKQKSLEKQQQNLKQNIAEGNQNVVYSAEGFTKLSKAKILNMQFFPMTLLITPTILFVETMEDPNFLLGCLLVQKYASLMLMTNVDFSQNKKLSYFSLLLMAGVHTLTGYYSLGTTIGMALATIFLPFKFCQQKQKLTEKQRQRMNTMAHLRIIYFFIFTLLTTVKAIHYSEVYEIQYKINKMNQQNLAEMRINQL